MNEPFFSPYCKFSQKVAAALNVTLTTELFLSQPSTEAISPSIEATSAGEEIQIASNKIWNSTNYGISIAKGNSGTSTSTYSGTNSFATAENTSASAINSSICSFPSTAHSLV